MTSLLYAGRGSLQGRLFRATPGDRSDLQSNVLDFLIRHSILSGLIFYALALRTLTTLW